MRASISFHLTQAAERPVLVGLGRFELPTSRLSGVRSDQLSYRPRVGESQPIPWKLNRGCFKSTFDLALSSLFTRRGFERTVAFRKEVIQPQVLLQLPCYDFTPIAGHTMGGCLPRVSAPTSGTTDFRDVTGGVYKARERIHPCLLIRDY
jgi:hypothetical protein